jgi:hypothetical protein
MRQKTPRSVSIGGQKFKILFRDLENDDWGQMLFDDRQILLSKKCLANPKILKDTLRHEVIHAALAVSGCSFADRFDEESIVRAIDNIFFPAWEKLENKLNP